MVVDRAAEGGDSGARRMTSSNLHGGFHTKRQHLSLQNRVYFVKKQLMLILDILLLCLMSSFINTPSLIIFLVLFLRRLFFTVELFLMQVVIIYFCISCSAIVCIKILTLYLNCVSVNLLTLLVLLFMFVYHDLHQILCYIIYGYL